MCGFFAFTTGMSAREIADMLEVSNLPRSLKEIESLKFYPKSPIPTVSRNSPNQLILRYWSLVPRWWHKPLAELKFSTFNARGEEIAQKASYKTPWKEAQRCLIPATWFYEFEKMQLQSKKTISIPYRVESTQSEVFTMGGLYETTKIDEQVIESVTIITVAAIKPLSAIHDRQPVIIHPKDRDKWLDKATPIAEVEKLLQPDAELALQKIEGKI